MKENECRSKEKEGREGVEEWKAKPNEGRRKEIVEAYACMHRVCEKK